MLKTISFTISFPFITSQEKQRYACILQRFFSALYLSLNQNARGKKPKLLFFPLFTARETFFSNHPLVEVLRTYLFTVFKKQIKKCIVNRSTIICQHSNLAMYLYVNQSPSATLYKHVFEKGFNTSWHLNLRELSKSQYHRDKSEHSSVT